MNCNTTTSPIGSHAQHDAKSVHDFLLGVLPSSSQDAEIVLLVDQLNSDEYAKREAAEKQLIAKGVNAIGLLSQESQTGTTESQYRSRRAIAAIESTMPQVIDAAIHVLRLAPDDQPSAQQRLETLLRICHHIKSLGLHQSAAAAIVELAHFDNQKVILQGIESQDIDQKTICIAALPRCCDAQQLQGFADLITDSDPRVSLAAINAFGEVAAERSMQQLVEVLIQCDQASIRTRSLELLRGLSGKYFELVAQQAPQNQQAALAKWRNWLADNKQHSLTAFEKYNQSKGSAPVGFLVSSSGSQVTFYDAEGNEDWALAVPLYDARACSGQRLLICERSLNRVRLIDRKGATLRMLENLESPSDAELLQNDNILVLQGTGSVVEYDTEGKLVKQLDGLQSPFDVDRLDDGNILVADSGNNRIVEFDPAGKIIWEVLDLEFPNNVFRLSDGRTLYTTYTSGLVGLLSPTGEKIWERNIERSTLYSVYHSGGRIYVSDGGQKRIVILNMQGQQVQEIGLKSGGFCDVDFVTKNTK